MLVHEKYFTNNLHTKQEHRSAGAQERKSTGAQERKSTGAQERRSAGAQERRSAGAQECVLDPNGEFTLPPTTQGHNRRAYFFEGAQIETDGQSFNKHGHFTLDPLTLYPRSLSLIICTAKFFVCFVARPLRVAQPQNTCGSSQMSLWSKWLRKFASLVRTTRQRRETLLLLSHAHSVLSNLLRNKRC